ncbi:hypothetical protein ACSMCR_24745, partial [Salmonella enterica]|uniref:hypothetical protein n=1 Tax=Salmonella enterica TaxID=28901 RepID=UPI003F1C82CB
MKDFDIPHTYPNHNADPTLNNLKINNPKTKINRNKRKNMWRKKQKHTHTKRKAPPHHKTTTKT